MMPLNKKLGFTLVELLVVIAIIGLIASFSVIALGNARSKSRDSKRVSDIKQIQTALELFFSDQGRYPTVAEWNSGSLAIAGSMGTTTYLSSIPSAPISDGALCDATSSAYSYASNGDTYTLSTCLGENTGSHTKGIIIASPGGVAKCGTATASDRDGNIYNTVQIGTQCWLKQNLRVGTMKTAGTGNQADAQNGVIEKYCYDNSLAICTTDGGLYQWHTVMGFPITCDSVLFNNNSGTCGGVVYTINPKHQGICPVGYHIPTDGEWHTLELYLTDPGQSCNNNRAYDDYTQCSTSNTKLKPGGSSGFEGIITGYGGASTLPIRRGADGLYTSASQSSGDAFSVVTRYIYSGSNGYLRKQSWGKLWGTPLRCIKD